MKFQTVCVGVLVLLLTNASAEEPQFRIESRNEGTDSCLTNYVVEYEHSTLYSQVRLWLRDDPRSRSSWCKFCNPHMDCTDENPFIQNHYIAGCMRTHLVATPVDTYYVYVHQLQPDYSSTKFGMLPDKPSYVRTDVPDSEFIPYAVSFHTPYPISIGVECDEKECGARTFTVCIQTRRAYYYIDNEVRTIDVVTEGRKDGVTQGTDDFCMVKGVDEAFEPCVPVSVACSTKKKYAGSGRLENVSPCVKRVVFGIERK